MTPKETAAVIKILPTKKKQKNVHDQIDCFSAEFYQTFKRRPNTSTLQTVPQNRNRRNTTQLVL